MKSTPTTQIKWIAIGPDLMDCLRTKTNHRLSRYDAFIWLIENIHKGNQKYDNDGKPIGLAPFSCSYVRLAQEWNWARKTVQFFIEDLVRLSAIATERKGNKFFFTIGTNSHKHFVL